MEHDDILAIFYQECDEGLATAEQGLGALAGGSTDTEELNAVFRAVHSIKGGAGAFGLDALVAYAHCLETVLDHLRAGRLTITPDLVRLLQRSRDLLDDHVQSAQDGSPPPHDAAIESELAALAADPRLGGTVGEAPATPAVEADDDFGFVPVSIDLDALDAPSADADWVVRFFPGPGALCHGNEPVLLLRELDRLGTLSVTPDCSRLVPLDALDTGAALLGWTIRLPGATDEMAIRDIFDFVVDDCELGISRDVEATGEPATAMPEPVAAILAAPTTPDAPPREMPTHTTERATIRVDLDKVDQLVNLVGELVITQSMMVQRFKDLRLDLREELDDLSNLTREMQDAVMSMRAQPVRTAFARVPRLLRDLEIETGKSVALDVTGETTEVDKTVVDRIGEPLVHLIRNAVDHGMESPTERLAAGKPAQGLIRLSAEHRSGRIVISVSDDGRGINRDKVRAKAIERGVIAADAALSDEDLDNLIFAPGFSTADTVSNISGRGVGLDVVRRNVASFGGRVALTSLPGQGSTFRLTLPLTLAVLDGMVVKASGDTYVIPLANIVECIRPNANQVRSLGPGSELLELRGTHLPIVDLSTLLLGDAPKATASETAYVIVDCEHLGRAALRVDSIDDQRQVVIKSLEANFRAVAGLAGATILGDGKVALILDPESLIALSRQRPSAALPALAA